MISWSDVLRYRFYGGHVPYVADPTRTSRNVQCTILKDEVPSSNLTEILILLSFLSGVMTVVVVAL